jgi:hypothetical protein
MTIIRTTIRSAALVATCVVGSLAGASTVGAADRADVAAMTLESICVAHGGSFHVNTYEGVNLICSAPRYLGDFASERAACERAAGEFSRTGVVEGRASWFCRRMIA